jgi:integrase/recombinase XerD
MTLGFLRGAQRHAQTNSDAPLGAAERLQVLLRRKDTSLDHSTARLTLGPAIYDFLTGRIREDPSEGLRNYVRANTRRGFANPSTVSTIVRRALARAGLSPALKGAHLFRHSLATRMLRHGASLPEIGVVLRHRTVQTTEIYAKVDLAGLRTLAQPWPEIRGAR